MAGAFKPTYFLHGDMDTTIEEHGDTFVALRKVQWAKDGAESDESKAKVEIRKWKITEDGEVPLKGVSFSTEDGPDNCVMALIDNGYGSTKDILLALKERKDFKKSVETMYDDTDTSDASGEYFDARELLLSE